MHLTPRQLFDNYSNKRLDKTSTINALITFVENSEIDEDRIKSLEYLRVMGVYSNNFFKLLENLLISDQNPKLRALSCEIMGEFFKDEALEPFRWAIKNEYDYDSLVTIIRNLVKIKDGKVREILIEEIKKIKRCEFIDDDREYPNKKFEKSIKTCIKRKRSKKMPLDKLGEILINYYTIKTLIERFYTIYFDWDEEGEVSSLDLSEIGWNVNIWKQKYADRVRNLSEIIGLKNLRNLKRLDLSNNYLDDIKDLTELKELTDLFLCNNRLVDEKNVKYLKDLPNLKHVDISGNGIVKKVKTKEFPNTHIVKYHGIDPRIEAFKLFSSLGS